jgi:hypothetical protein
LEKTVDGLEVSAAVTRVEGVSKVNQLRISESTGPEVEEISMQGLELPRVMKVAVVEGDALTIEEVRGEQNAPALSTDGKNIMPVPIVSDQC